VRNATVAVGRSAILVYFDSFAEVSNGLVVFPYLIVGSATPPYIASFWQDGVRGMSVPESQRPTVVRLATMSPAGWLGKRFRRVLLYSGMRL
jgi:hypothetical protein